jgi:hypothetical protein
MELVPSFFKGLTKLILQAMMNSFELLVIENLFNFNYNYFISWARHNKTVLDGLSCICA